MVEFDVSNGPTVILATVARYFDATIRVYGINTITDRLNQYGSIGDRYRPGLRTGFD